MPDEEKRKPEEHGEDMPASMIFMEIMRQAAKKSETKPPALNREARLNELRAGMMARQAEAEKPKIETPPEPAVPPTPEPVVAPPVETPPAPVVETPVATVPVKVTNEEESTREAALEAQRIRRIKRRQQKRRARTVSVFGGIFRSFLVIIPSALLMATILSWFTEPRFLRAETRDGIQAALANTEPTEIPTAVPTPNYLKRIGIVSGHRGPGQDQPYDPGAVCSDGLTENEINFNVATMVVVELRNRGYNVELMEEWDPRLNGYKAEALISIHSNDCSDYGEGGTGYLVSHAEARGEGSPDSVLRECLATHYESATGLPRHLGLTRDMTDYHIFREIDVQTPGTIIELGFMLRDREILTQRPDVLAHGIVNGILCFIEPDMQPVEQLRTPTATP